MQVHSVDLNALCLLEFCSWEYIYIAWCTGVTTRYECMPVSVLCTDLVRTRHGIAVCVALPIV